MDKQAQLEDLVTHIAELRAQKELAGDKFAQANEKLTEIVETLLPFKDREDAKAELVKISEAEEQLVRLAKELALEVSAETDYDDRKPVGGIEIKKFTVVEITDLKEAKIWAAENAPDLLTLNSTFQNAVSKLSLPFTNKKVEYRAQISSKLEDVV